MTCGIRNGTKSFSQVCNLNIRRFGRWNTDSTWLWGAEVCEADEQFKDACEIRDNGHRHYWEDHGDDKGSTHQCRHVLLRLVTHNGTTISWQLNVWGSTQAHCVYRINGSTGSEYYKPNHHPRSVAGLDFLNIYTVFACACSCVCVGVFVCMCMNTIHTHIQGSPWKKKFMCLSGTPKEKLCAFWNIMLAKIILFCTYIYRYIWHNMYR